MNEQFQQYLMGIIEKTGEFLGNEIPEIANQILLFNLVTSLFYCGVTFITACFCTRYCLCYFKKGIANASDTEDILSAFGVVAGVVSIAVFIDNLIPVLKIWLAPKLYLLEYASSLVK